MIYICTLCIDANYIPVVLVHTYIVLKTRDQFPQTLLLHLWQSVVLVVGGAYYRRNQHMSPTSIQLSFGNRPSGCYIIILYALCNRLLASGLYRLFAFTAILCQRRLICIATYIIMHYV